MNSSYFIKNILIIISIFSLITFISCEKQIIEENEYYINYRVESNTIYSGRTLKVEYINEKNESVVTEIPANKNWEIIIGPCSKGFNSYIIVREVNTSFGKLKLGCEISCSKNNSPFVVKQNDKDMTPRTWMELEYTIDY